MLSSDLCHRSQWALPLVATDRCFKRRRGWRVGGIGGDALSTNLLQAPAAAYASTIADAFDPETAEEANTSDVSAEVCSAPQLRR